VIVVAADQDPLAVRAERDRPGVLAIVHLDLFLNGARLEVVDLHSLALAIGKILAIGGEVQGRLCGL